MRLPGDDDDRGIGAPVVYTIIGVSVFILVVLAAVFISNNGQKNTQAARKNLSRPTSTPAQEEEMRFAQGQEDMEELYRENKLRAEIIDSYSDVTVSVYEDDPTVCLVEFSFAVAHGLNQIYLTAHITI